MSIINKIVIKIHCKVVGTDQFGNQYYENNTSNASTNSKRYVIYRGNPEPSKIPPLWHAWLHHISDELPTKKQVNDFIWQRNHEPNLTGSSLAYSPLPHGSARPIVSSDYKIWQPK